MTDMTGNILNRVRRLPKPTKPAQALQPLFEAVSNAMHAIEDQFPATAITSGHINITITNLAAPARSQIIIADNGIGLTNDRFLAFCTTDTDFKLPRGGKGIGRLLWLDAFDRIKVTSIFEEGVRRLQRSFRFQLSQLDQITDETIEPAKDGAVVGTVLEFSGLRGSYATKFPGQPDRLIRYFGAHFFAEFILEKAPQITLFVDDRTAIFPGDVRDLLASERGRETITTKEYGELALASFVCKKAASTEFDGLHQLHFAANGRTVTTRKIDGIIGIGRFGEADDLVYHGCVAGTFLDERVNQERTQFNFDETVSDDIAKICAEKICTGALRVCPKSSSSQTKLSEHEANRGEAEKSECVSGEIFKILGQAATAIEPSEGAFDDPPPW